MLKNVKVLCHSSIKICSKKVIYIDPFKIQENYNDADIIFITHGHYDHYSQEDINKVKKDNTIIIAPKDLIEKIEENDFEKNKIIPVEPNNLYAVENVKFETVFAYNITKNFHPKENNWVGYIIEIDNLRYYIAGDTDFVEENKKVECDVAFVPVGGTYTMNSIEAANFVNTIKPRIAVPIHYGSIVGKYEDAVKFVSLLDENIEGEILLK